MLNLLKSIFARCPHVWKEYDTYEIRSSRETTIGKASCCYCEKCGERRMFKMVL